MECGINHRIAREPGIELGSPEGQAAGIDAAAEDVNIQALNKRRICGMRVVKFARFQEFQRQPDRVQAGLHLTHPELNIRVLWRSIQNTAIETPHFIGVIFRRMQELRGQLDLMWRRPKSVCPEGLAGVVRFATQYENVQPVYRGCFTSDCRCRTARIRRDRQRSERIQNTEVLRRIGRAS